ncbi:MAG: lipopolysaccharide assembly protein LapA domain-containing protein [Steroidobacteraceae bacterium]
MKRVALIGLLVLLALAALVFAILNPATFPLELGFVRVAAPIGVALIGAFAAGMLLGVLWRVSWVASLLGERGRLRRALRLAEAEARSASRPHAS